MTPYSGAAPPRRTRRGSSTTTRLHIHGRTVEVPITELHPTPMQQEEEAKERAFRHALAHRALNAITGKQYDVVWRFYGFYSGEPMDFLEIADDLGMSLNTTYVHHHRAMSLMRQALGIPPGGLKR